MDPHKTPLNIQPLNPDLSLTAVNHSKYQVNTAVKVSEYPL